MEEPRPLKISFRKLALREDYFSKARHLQKTKFKDVSIVPDLAKQQRDEDKELSDEADRLNDQLSESVSLNWHYRCIGKGGERIISKLKVSVSTRGPYQSTGKRQMLRRFSKRGPRGTLATTGQSP